MADKNATLPRSLEEAKELARQNMLAARARTESDDATPAPTQVKPETDDDEPTTADPEPSDEDDATEDETSDAGEDEAADDEDDSDDSDGDEDPEDDDEDDDEDEEAAPAPKPEPKRKPSRRSKKISKLQDTIARLEAESASQEERLLRRLEEEQARRAALEAEKRQREADERALEAEMAEYLGTDEEYQRGIEAMMRGDVFETEKVREWHERRQIVGKLSRRAEQRVNQRAAEIFWASTEGLPGVDKKVLQEQSFGDVLKHLHAAGFAAAQAEAKKELDRATQRIARLEAQLKEKKVKTVVKAAKADPVEGGVPAPPRREKSIYEQSIEPDGQGGFRINRAKFEELKRKAGAAAL